MADDMIYDASAGGGRGDGTTSGQTGMSPLNDKTMDDREFSVNAAQQEEAEENYRPHPEMPQMMTNNSSPDGPFHGLVTEPHGEAANGSPTMGSANVIHNPDLGISREKEQEIAQAAMNSTSDGIDEPRQEV